jgi:hypothetical protein
MLEYDYHPSMFDPLGQPKFDRVCHLLIQKEVGASGYMPGPHKAQDGGIDSQYIKQETGKPKTQFKYRVVASANDKDLRSAVLGEFKKWLEDQCSADSTDTYLFVTNVRRTKGDQDKTAEICAKYPSARIEYWDYEKLCTLMDAHPDIAKDCLKIFNSEELQKRQNELDEQAAALAAQAKAIYLKTPEFVTVSLKFKAQFIDLVLLAKTYHGFLYIVEPVYVDNQDGVRATMRELFQIDEATEGKVLETLKTDGRIDITGNVITVNKVDEAEAAAKDMVDQIGPDLQKVISLIQGA